MCKGLQRMVYVFLVDGFEEIEALTTVDFLRRASLDVTVVGIGSSEIAGSHGIKVVTDSITVQYEDMEAIILPGGMPGTLNLEKSSLVQECLQYANSHRLLIGAICAAPSVLGHKGLLVGKNATCYPGFEQELTGAFVNDAAVVQDENIITAKGAGVTIEFAAKIVSALLSAETANTVKEAMQCQ